MNFKKPSRVLCLLLVLCLLVNCSPIQAEASSVAAVAMLGVTAAMVVSSVFIGLGVMPNTDRGAFNTIVNECVSYLMDASSFVAGGLITVAQITSGTVVKYHVNEDLISMIRDWLFSSGTVEAVSLVATSGFSAMKTEAFSAATLKNMYASSPAMLMSLFKGLGVAQKAAVLMVSSSLLYSYHFDEDGIFTCSTYSNPLGVANASLFGVYDLTALHTYGFVSSSHVGTATPSSLSTSWTANDVLIFYDTSWASSYSGYLAGSLYAFDWASPITTATVDGYIYTKWPLLYKSSQNTVFNDSSSRYYLNIRVNGCYGAADIVWDGRSYTSYETTSDIKLGSIASPDVSVKDGYATWSAGSVALPGSTTGQSEEDEYLPYWPVGLPGTLDDTQNLTQDEVQTGTNTPSADVDSDAASDTVTASGLRSWIDSFKSTVSMWLARISLNVSNILEAVRDGFASLVVAVANIPNLIAGIFRFLAEQLRGIGFIWELLQMIGEYLGTIFGWMPETMKAIVMVTFAIAGLYMLIGR